MGNYATCCCASADERKEDSAQMKSDTGIGIVSIKDNQFAASKDKNLDTKESDMKEIENDGTENAQPISARGQRQESPEKA